MPDETARENDPTEPTLEAVVEEEAATPDDAPATFLDEERPEHPIKASEAGVFGPTNFWWGLAVLTAAIASTVIWFAPESLAPAGQTRGWFLIFLTYLIAGYGAWTDAAARIIPNRLNYPALLIGLSLNLTFEPLVALVPQLTPIAEWLGVTSPWNCFQGFALCVGIGIFGFMSRGLGGGDVKMLAALGALLGFSYTWPILANTLFIAAVFGVCNLLMHGKLAARLQIMATATLVALVTKRKLHSIYPFAKTEMPFGLSIFIAMLLTPFFQVHTLFI
ncbi:MAG: A24 family peptidase [Planctomycetota bacterium]